MKSVMGFIRLAHWSILFLLPLDNRPFSKHHQHLQEADLVVAAHTMVHDLILKVQADVIQLSNNMVALLCNVQEKEKKIIVKMFK